MISMKTFPLKIFSEICWLSPISNTSLKHAACKVEMCQMVRLVGEVCHDPNLYTLWWHHNEPNGVSNHQFKDCLLNRLFRCRSKKTSKLCVTGLCEGNSPVTGEFPAQRASNTENVSIWWRHHDSSTFILPLPSGSALLRWRSSYICWWWLHPCTGEYG